MFLFFISYTNFNIYLFYSSYILYILYWIWFLNCLLMPSSKYVWKERQFNALYDVFQVTECTDYNRLLPYTFLCSCSAAQKHLNLFNFTAVVCFFVLVSCYTRIDSYFRWYHASNMPEFPVVNAVRQIFCIFSKRKYITREYVILPIEEYEAATIF